LLILVSGGPSAATSQSHRRRPSTCELHARHPRHDRRCRRGRSSGPVRCAVALTERVGDALRLSSGSRPAPSGIGRPPPRLLPDPHASNSERRPHGWAGGCPPPSGNAVRMRPPWRPHGGHRCSDGPAHLFPLDSAEACTRTRSMDYGYKDGLVRLKKNSRRDTLLCKGVLLAEPLRWPELPLAWHPEELSICQIGSLEWGFRKWFCADRAPCWQSLSP